MTLFLDGSVSSHLNGEVTKVKGLGTKQPHGGLRVQPGTKEHGEPCPELAQEGV